jgi:hypothetical protein
MHKESFIINCNTVLHVSTLLGHLQGELFALQTGTTESSRLQKQRSPQSTAHSHSTIKCKLSVTITRSSPWRWPSRIETCRSMLRLMIKLSLCICWWLVFLCNTVHGHGTHYTFLSTKTHYVKRIRCSSNTCTATIRCQQITSPLWQRHVTLLLVRSHYISYQRVRVTQNVSNLVETDHS